MKIVYFDNAATTSVNPFVRKAICDSFDIYGNPSSNHTLGISAKELLNKSRSNIENSLKLPTNSFIFTGSGSEADNMAIRMAVEYGLLHNRNKIITSTVEHHAVLNTIKSLNNVEIVYVDVDNNGKVDINKLSRMIDYRTSLVSFMTSNNETGVMFDIYTIAEIIHRKGGLFHTDAVQGITHMPIASALVDMYSISGHKLGAPKGVGGLYVNPALLEEFKDYSITKGGGQEFHLRAGTENVPYAVGLSRAVELLVENRHNKNETITNLNNYFVQQLHAKFPHCKINGDISLIDKNPGIINFSIGYADAASVVTWMSLNNICISSGSACNTGSSEPSHVLTAMGLSRQEAFSSIRISFSENNTYEEIDYFMDVLKQFEKTYK